MSDSAGGPPESEHYLGPPADLPPAEYPPPDQSVYPPPAYPASPTYPASPAYPAVALKPGVIPLRPLTLAEIFNGAVAYIRTNPKATLGVTAIVIVVAQVLGLVLQLLPLAAGGTLDPKTADPAIASDDVTAFMGPVLTGVASGLTVLVATIVLNGLLTVVVGRAVFGAAITPGEAWRRARGRILPLLGLTALEVTGLALLIAVAVVGTLGVAALAGPLAAFFTGLIVTCAGIVAVVYVTAILAFAPAVVVLERRRVVDAIGRSYTLVHKDFWRVFGIGLLAVLVAGAIAFAVSVPFGIGGQLLLLFSNPSTGDRVLALALTAVGGAIGRIITAPFSSGVVVLLYADRRMRAEAFDLVLQTGATVPAAAGTDATDALWLTAHR